VRRRGVVVLALALVAAALPVGPAESQAVRGAYIYTLSGFTGKIPYNHARLAVDRERNESYVLYQNSISVFNDSGMEVYRFGDDLDLGHIVDLAIDEQGDIFLLVFRDARASIVRCDYRGRPQAEITLSGLPRDFATFNPNRMTVHRGQFFLAATMGLQVITADREGNFAGGYDLFRMFELEEKDRGNVEIGGFGVDRDGNVLMTVPVLFRAYVLSPDGKLASFGKPGGAPGRFNVVGGIARDSRGNLLVVDKLKAAVLVFDPRFQFVTQFASRGYRPGELIFPDDLAVDAADRVYVTQVAKRGVSVFKLTYADEQTGGASPRRRR
jgi:hypothetical protein